MEALRATRGPVSRLVKQPSINKGKVTRQPLVRIGNKSSVSTTPNAKKSTTTEKPESNQSKQSKVLTKKDVSVEFAFSSSSLPDGVEMIDEDDESNPQLVSCYVNDIYRYLRKLEARFPIRCNFLDGQTEITCKMRAVLVDWLIQVHSKFHLLPETLYLTVSLIDRFLQAERVGRSKLQLVGVTAMLIASKYEEMYAPDVVDFVYITDKAYSKRDILQMELTMLFKLDFCLGKPLPLHFLRRNSKAGRVDSTMHTLAKFLMELHLVEYELAHYCPSIIAAAALYLSIKLLENGEWTLTLAYYSGYEEKDILPVASKICKTLLSLSSSRFQAVPKKYASKKLMEVSTLSVLQSSFVRNLAAKSA